MSSSLPSASFASIDSLPYVDVEAPFDYQAYAVSLIEEEMRAMERDEGVDTRAERYLSSMPPLPGASRMSDLVRLEVEKVQKQKKNMGNSAMPGGPLSLRSPSWAKRPSGSLKSDIDAWKSALTELKAKIESERARLVNLELMKSFGQSSWLQHNASLRKVCSSTEDSLQSARLEADVVNGSRSEAQEAIRPMLDSLGSRFHELAYKNANLKRVNQALTEEIEQLLRSKRARTTA